MTQTLRGKVAWITGGGSGIGFAGAQHLLAAGATVVISGRNPATTQTSLEQLATLGTVQAHVLDVADKLGVARTAEAILSQHGRIDILVNSAGTNTVNRSLDNISLEDWDAVVAANFSGLFYVVRSVLPAMRRQQDGLIVNVSSWASLYPSRPSGVAYGASKRAVNSLTESINAEEAAHGIRATALIPGEVATPILDKRPIVPSQDQRDAMIQPEDMGRAIRFLAEMPGRVCVNELVITPTVNRFFYKPL